MAANVDAYIESLTRDEQVQSVLVLALENRPCLFDGADFLYLIVANVADSPFDVRNIVSGETNLLVYRVSQWQLESWAAHGIDEKMNVLLMQGDLLIDRQDYVKRYRERLAKGNQKRMKQQVCTEYSRFLRYYLEAKEFLQRKHAMDAYQSVVHALQTWAKLVIMETGESPTSCLWAQVKQIDPSVYKLYEELVTSQEPLEKRVELMLLPIEVSVLSKMKACTQLILDILQSDNRPWFLQELLQHPEIIKRDIDLHILLDKMAKRSLVMEIAVLDADGNIYEKGYLFSG